MYTGVVAILIDSAAQVTVSGLIFAGLTISRAPGVEVQLTESLVIGYELFGSLFLGFCVSEKHAPTSQILRLRLLI